MKERWSSVSDKFLSFFFSFFLIMDCHFVALISQLYAAHLQCVMTVSQMSSFASAKPPEDKKRSADQDGGMKHVTR